MNKTIKQDFKIRLLASASHIGNTGGIDAEFHRIPLMQDGRKHSIPCFTGNSLRGHLRDASAIHLMRTLEIESLPLKMFYLLFSGGSLEKGAGGISLEKARQLRHLLPSVSMWGAASGNHIMAGKWNSGFIMPHAIETASIMRLESRAGLPSVYDLMHTQEYTRMDDAKDVRKESMIQTEAMQKTLIDLETKRKSELADAPGVAQQMRYRVETMIAGVELSWRAPLVQVTQVEAQAWYAALATWGENPTIGGKSAVGHGLVEMRAEDIDISPDGVKTPSYAGYEEHLRQHAQEIKALLYG